MGGADFHLSLRLADVGGGHLGSGQLCWMAAKGIHLTCATKNLIIHLQWTEGDELVLDDSVSSPATPSTLTGSTLRFPRQRTSSTFSNTPPRRTPSGSSSSTSSSSLLFGSNSPQTPSPQHQASIRSRTMSTSSFSSRAGVPPSTPTSGRHQQQQQQATTPRSPAFSLALKKAVPGTRLRRVVNLAKRPVLVSLVDSPTDVSIGFVDPGRRR